MVTQSVKDYSPSVFPLEARFLGRVNLSYQSSGSVLTLVMRTDGTIQAEGFSATYTKLYSGTDLIGMCVAGAPPPVRASSPNF